MINLLIKAKNSMFGIVVCLWGLMFLFTPALSVEPSLHLLSLTISTPILGFSFIVIGIIYILSKIWNQSLFASLANVMIATAFLFVTFSYLYLSWFALAWIAFLGVAIHQIINAFLILRNR